MYVSSHIREKWPSLVTWSLDVPKSFWIECLEKHSVSQRGISALVKELGRFHTRTYKVLVWLCHVLSSLYWTKDTLDHMTKLLCVSEGLECPKRRTKPYAELLKCEYSVTFWWRPSSVTCFTCNVMKRHAVIFWSFASVQLQVLSQVFGQRLHESQ